MSRYAVCALLIGLLAWYVVVSTLELQRMPKRAHMALPEGYLTVKEVAEMIGVNAATIGRWERAKMAPEPKRLKRTWQRLYTKEDVEILRKVAHGIVCGSDRVFS